MPDTCMDHTRKIYSTVPVSAWTVEKIPHCLCHFLCRQQCFTTTEIQLISGFNTCIWFFCRCDTKTHWLDKKKLNCDDCIFSQYMWYIQLSIRWPVHRHYLSEGASTAVALTQLIIKSIPNFSPRFTKIKFSFLIVINVWMIDSTTMLKIHWQQ